ncbi:hypothetical protein RRG08_042791, partial [Elysia crispata]
MIETRCLNHDTATEVVLALSSLVMSGLTSPALPGNVRLSPSGQSMCRRGAEVGNDIQ